MAVGAAIAGATLVGGLFQADAAKKAAKTAAGAAEAGIAEQRATRGQALELAQPFVDIGLQAGEQLQNLLADPSQGLEQINPIVSFLRDQGFEQIQESAAAKGRLGAGGTLEDLTRFNTNLASTVVPQLQNQRFNQLFNVLGLGQNAAAGQGSAALQTGANISNLLGNVGASQAGGAIGQANAITGTIQNLAGVAGGFSNALGANFGTGTTAANTPSFFGSGPIPSQLTQQNILGATF